MMRRFASELRLSNFVTLFLKQIKDQEKLICELQNKVEQLKLEISPITPFSLVAQIHHQMESLKIEQNKEEKHLRKLKTKLYFYERELNNLKNNQNG